MLQIKDIFWCVVRNSNSGKFYEQYFRIILQNNNTSQKIHYDIGRRYYHLASTKYIIRHLAFWVVGINLRCDSRLNEIDWENTTGKNKYIIIAGIATKAKDSYDRKSVYFSGIVSRKCTKISFVNKETLNKIEKETTLSSRLLFNFKIGDKFSYSKEQFISSYVEPVNNLIKE